MCDGPYTSSDIDSLIENAKKAAKERYKMEKLKELYFKVIRPELQSRFLLHSYPFEDGCTHWLRYQNDTLDRIHCRFTSCYDVDVAVRLLEMPRSVWVFFFNYLAEERICVIEEWRELSTVEYLFYDHGPKDFSDVHFYKGEVDASWFQPKDTADISILIWDDHQVICAKTYLGLTECRSSDISEVKAAFVLLTEAQKLGIKNFVLCTDSLTVAEVLSGKRHVADDNTDVDLFRALRSMRESFDRVVVKYVPRELNVFADGMLNTPRIACTRKKKITAARYVLKSAQMWSYQLNGYPLFRLSMTPKAAHAMKTFGKPPVGELTNRKYFVIVTEEMKLSAVNNIITVLDQATFCVAVKDIHNKSEEVLNGLYDMVGNSCSSRIVDSWSLLFSDQNPNHQGGLLIVFDGYSSECVRLEVEGVHNTDFTICLCAQESTDSLIKEGYMELSASAYIHFRGPKAPKSK